MPRARIVAVACEMTKMLSPRGIKAPAGVEDAIIALQQGRAALFEAKVVDACIRLFREKRYAIAA